MEQITSQLIPLHGAACTMRGGRPENQDDMGWIDTPLGFLLVVCDGMGGGPGGKTASYIAKYEIFRSISESSTQATREMALKVAANKAHEALEQKMKEVPNLAGMGSTFVAILINRESAVIAHAGDSRCYCFRGKRCVYRSQDHSLVAELVRRKALTEEEARRSPQANVITRGLGSTTNQVPEIDEIPFRKGDRFVVCTDGVWGTMPHPELLRKFVSPRDPQQLVGSLPLEIDNIGLSSGGHHDNHTLAVFDMEVGSELKNSLYLNKQTLIYATVLVALVCVIVISVLIIKKIRTKTDEAIYYPSQTSTAPVLPSTNLGGRANTHESQFSGTTPPAPSSTGTPQKEAIITNDSNDIPLVLELRNKILSKISSKSSDTVQQTTTEKVDSTTKVNNEVHSECEVLVQKCINRYKDAKKVKTKPVKEAVRKVERYHSEIKKYMRDLCQQLQSKPMLSKAEAIERMVDDEWTWKISSDGTPTHKAVKLMDKQIERLEKLKSEIKKENKE